jgi:lysozyme
MGDGIMMTNAVIDLSHYQTVTSFADVKAAGVTGVIHKATQGTDFTDPEYAARKPSALQAGLLWGAYHFGDGNSSGADQASYFLSVVKPGPRDLLALDFEENTDPPGAASMTLQQARDFVQQVAQATGRYPGIYGGSYLMSLLGGATDPVLQQCWLWISSWNPGPPAIPPNWPCWTMWQYTSTGTINGIAGDGVVDCDNFNGPPGQLHKLWIAAPAAAGEPGKAAAAAP